MVEGKGVFGESKYNNINHSWEYKRTEKERSVEVYTPQCKFCYHVTMILFILFFIFIFLFLFIYLLFYS